jgi:hypothetical protein
VDDTRRGYGLIAQAKVYGNWLASSPAVIVVNNASVLA